MLETGTLIPGGWNWAGEETGKWLSEISRILKGSGNGLNWLLTLVGSVLESD